MTPTEQVQFWAVKQEPESYSWDDLVREKKTVWSGVRNFQARANLKKMRPGDLLLFYHTGDAKEIVGIAKVDRAAYPDPTAAAGEPWVVVDVSPLKPLRTPVTLQSLKKEATLAEMPLVRQGRLSVSPVTSDQFKRILALAGTTS